LDGLSTLIEQELNQEVLSYTVEEMSVVAEIYLAETCCRLHYNQLLDKNEFPELMSSRQFAAWLNDRKGRLNKTLIPGLLRLYVADNPKHFKDGRWLAVHLPIAMGYIYDKTQDRGCVKDPKVRLLFAQSFTDREWVRCATGVFGLKMLEFLAVRKRLWTEYGRAVVQATLESREIEKSFIAGLGRYVKNGLPESDFRRLEQLAKNYSPQLFRNILEKIESEATREYRNYLKIKSRLEGLLQRLADRAKFSAPEGRPALPSPEDLQPEALQDAFW
jgi:hypothetical protein